MLSLSTSNIDIDNLTLATRLGVKLAECSDWRGGRRRAAATQSQNDQLLAGHSFLLAAPVFNRGFDATPLIGKRS